MHGVVQGVGSRPFVCGLAIELYVSDIGGDARYVGGSVARGAPHVEHAVLNELSRYGIRG